MRASSVVNRQLTPRPARLRAACHAATSRSRVARSARRRSRHCFGRHSHYPLRVDTRTDQADPGGTFRLADAADGDLDVIRDGQPQYRVEARPRTLDDFEPTCWWHQTSPRSHFTQGPVCSRLTETGRVTLSDRTLVQTTGDRRRERTLTSDAEVLAAYRTWFGIVLDRVPDRPGNHPVAPPARPR
jgi:N-hydroxyarylamine O-acetyltransferase